MPRHAIAIARFNGADFNVTGAAGLTLRSPDPVKLWFAPGFGVHIKDSVGVSVGNWSVDYDPPWTHRTAGLTYQLTNCTDVVTEDLTIVSAPQMAITAFLGGGGHVFRRVRFAPGAGATNVASQDAMHFTDLRRGPLVEDSVVGFSGDDFFNVHNSLMLVLDCPSPRVCVLINPHTGQANPDRPLYGGYTAMRTVKPADHLSFYGWPAEDVKFPDLGQAGAVSAEIAAVTAVAVGSVDAALQAKLSAVGEAVVNHTGGGWTEWTNTSFAPNTGGWLWRVELAAPLPARAYSALTADPRGVAGPAVVSVDEQSSAGAVIRNNVFSHTACNLGRFKSPGGSIEGNSFSHASLRNLELTELLQYYEGPVRLDGIVVRGNTFSGAGPDPIHCGPLCERHVVRNGNAVQCLALAGTPQACEGCPDCSAPTAWATAAVSNNTVFPKPKRWHGPGRRHT